MTRLPVPLLRLGVALIAAAALSATSAGPGMAQDAAVVAKPASEKPVVVTPLGSRSTTAAGQPIRLPQGDVTVAMSDYRIAPGAVLPAHKHPYPRYAYVTAGTLTVTQVDSGEVAVYGPGALIVESVDLWHFGANLGPDPVHLIVFDQTPTGAPATILKP